MIPATQALPAEVLTRQPPCVLLPLKAVHLAQDDTALGVATSKDRDEVEARLSEPNLTES